MKRLPLSANLDPPKLTPDTVVEVTSSGDVETVDAGLPRQTGKLGDVVDVALRGYRATYADPARLPEHLSYSITVEEVTDAKLGSNNCMALVSQPPGSELVVPAAEVALEHKGTLIAMAPALGSLCDWDQVKDDLERLRLVTKYREKVGVRYKNLVALDANLRQRIFANLTLAQKQAAPVIAANRSLEVTMAPFTDLFTNAAEKGATTRRVVAKALKKSGKKGKKAAPGVNDDQDRKDGQDSKADAPTKDTPPGKDGR